MEDVKLLSATDLDERLALVAYAFQWELSERNLQRFDLLSEHSWNYGSVDEDGKLASQIMATPFKVDLLGTQYDMVGIGFVASYPEYRSQGRVDRIMGRILQDCYEKGVELSYLAPFSYPFYRRYGYELTFERAVYDVPASEWPDSQKVAGKVVRVAWNVAKDQIAKIYQQCGRHHKGGVLREGWWLDYKFVLRRDYTYALYYNETNEVEGYLIYQIQHGVLTIAEWTYLSNEAFCSLNRFIASHNGSVAKIQFDTGYDGSNLQFLTTTPLQSFSVRPEMMTRVVDVEKFLRKYPFTNHTGTNEIVLEIEEDRYCPWNTGGYSLAMSDDKMTIKKLESEWSGEVDVKMSIQHFAQLFMGYKSAEELAFHHLIQGTQTAVEFLQQVLPNQKPILEDYF